MKIVGIDPGSVSGALAMIGSGTNMICDFATIERQVDAHWLAQALRTLAPDVVVVENVHSMPKQGVSSTFSFGVSVGIVHGVTAALGIRMELVTPGTWKKHFTLAGKDNEATRAAAMRRHPLLAASLTLKKHHNRASALMIATWFEETKP